MRVLVGARRGHAKAPGAVVAGHFMGHAGVDQPVEGAIEGDAVVPETLRRMVSVFPAEERDGRLMDITEALQTIVTQRLVRTTDGQRAAIREYLRFTASMKDEILARPAAQVVSATRKAVLDFGRPLTVDLDALKAAGRIDEREYALFRGLGTQLE